MVISTHNLPKTHSSMDLNQPSRSFSMPIPDGYVTIAGPDGQQYVVPRFLVPSTHEAFRSYQQRVDLNANGASGGVSHFLFNVCVIVHGHRCLSHVRPLPVWQPAPGQTICGRLDLLAGPAMPLHCVARLAHLPVRQFLYIV
jgi:hypothetical protein